MFNMAAEKSISRYILIGAPVVTVFVVTDSVTDPVNVTKLAALGAFGIAIFVPVIFFGLKEILKTSRMFIIVTLFFIAAMLNSTFNSSSPFSQNIYGAYGRNTGLIAYLILSLIAFSALLLRDIRSFRNIIFGLLIAGVIRDLLYLGNSFWRLPILEQPIREYIGTFWKP